jgi:hypothetical protein
MDFTTLTMEKQKHSHHYSDKPPYAERHVRWCERTVGELIPHLLLDYLDIFLLQTFCPDGAYHVLQVNDVW